MTAASASLWSKDVSISLNSSAIGVAMFAVSKGLLRYLGWSENRDEVIACSALCSLTVQEYLEVVTVVHGLHVSAEHSPTTTGDCQSPTMNIAGSPTTK